MKPFLFIFVFVFYSVIIMFFSSSISISLNGVLKNSISILYFVIGYSYFSTPDKFKQLSLSLNLFYLILVVNFIISNYFDLGTDAYTESSEFLVGNLDDRWNVFTYSLLIFPVVLIYRKTSFSKYVSIFLAFICLVILIFSLKRIAIVSLLVGYCVYGFLNLSIKNVMSFFLVFSFVGLLSFSLFSDVLDNRIEARSDRFDDGSLEREGRYLESFYVWEEVLEFENLNKSLFGLEAYNSVGNYGDGIFGERNIHVDYNLIVNTLGIVGLILYLLIFVSFYFQLRLVSKIISKVNKFDWKLYSIFWSLFISQFITSLGGQMYNITFRLIIFIFLGSILSNLRYSIYLNRLN